jgi:hypothetical protein
MQVDTAEDNDVGVSVYSGALLLGRHQTLEERRRSAPLYKSIDKSAVLECSIINEQRQRVFATPVTGN